jgi:dynein heavy chain
MLAIPTPTTNVLRQIYRAVMRGFLEEFDPEIREMSDIIVTASIDTYQFMAAQYRPTIAKAHYVFNMRDLSKCIQGILQANKAVIVTKRSMVR